MMNLLLTLSLTSLLGTSVNALSTLALPSTKPAGTSNTNFWAPLQRSTLKKNLIRAAKAKDEVTVLKLVEELSPLSPTIVPTFGLMGYTGGSSSSSRTKATTTTAPLDGAWKLLFTNAKDAEAPARTEKSSKSKDDSTTTFADQVKSGVVVTTGQRVTASEGKCVNYIRLDGDERPFDQLEITIRMTPLSDTRVRLDFQTGRALNSKAPLPFLRDFQFQFPPAVVGDILSRIKGKDPTREPPAYFDVMYIDNELRVHRTGEGKIFVQQRDM